MQLDESLVSESFCYLTTTGRRTRRPHEIEIWFVMQEADVYLLAEPGYRADWVQNLVADERVQLRIADRFWDGVASVVAGAADDGVVRRAMAVKYQGWEEGRPLSDWARSALLVKVRLISFLGADGSAPERG